MTNFLRIGKKGTMWLWLCLIENMLKLNWVNALSF